MIMRTDEEQNAKSAKRKEVQDRIVASKTIEKGLIIVHTGKGKGKSTAAFGMAVRMIGRKPICARIRPANRPHGPAPTTTGRGPV